MVTSGRTPGGFLPAAAAAAGLAAAAARDAGWVGAAAAALALFLAMGAPAAAQSFFDLKANDAQGNAVDFSQFKGKVVLVLNTASE